MQRNLTKFDMVFSLDGKNGRQIPIAYNTMHRRTSENDEGNIAWHSVNQNVYMGAGILPCRRQNQKVG